ncbi:MAG TPA: hypothetical protein PKN93_16490 [Leptospiraceae bacterium]|nr:hypothetical protein [Leptospiraceae bacterium]
MVQDEAAKTQPGPAPMSDQEAQGIVQALRSSLSADVLREQEKARQRIILLRERAYSQEREKRIEAFVQANGRRIIQPNRQDLEKAREFAERIGQFVQVEKKRIAEEERRERKRREEEEERLRKIRAEEAERRRLARLEEERRAAQEAHWSRVAGIWVATSGTVSGTMQIEQSGTTASGQIHWIQHDGYERVDTFAGKWNGSNISIRSTRMREIWKPPNVIAVNFSYSANVSQDGDSMAGYVQSAAYWHEVFVRGG